MSKRYLFAALALVFLLGASGCALIDEYFLPPPDDTAQELYEKGMLDMQQKEYADAADSFTKIRDKFPFSSYATDAELALGDAYFLAGSYPAALDAYREFESLHPAHEAIPYVLFQAGMSNYRMFRTIDVRQENITQGLEYFTRVRDEYPDSKYAAEAREYILKSRRVLADHELYVADFFWRTQRYGPAWHRYMYVRDNFADLPDIREYADRRAKGAYLEYQKTLSVEERERQNGSWKQWFDWL